MVQGADGQSLEIYVDCGMSNSLTAYDTSVGTKIDAFEPGVEYSGVVIRVVGGASGEASGAAAGGDVSEAAYQAYLKEYVDAVPAVSDEAFEEFAALIDAGDYESFPVDMCFTDLYWGYTAMTFEEFQAAGGVYEIPAFDPGLTQD